MSIKDKPTKIRTCWYFAAPFPYSNWIIQYNHGLYTVTTLKNIWANEITNPNASACNKQNLVVFVPNHFYFQTCFILFYLHSVSLNYLIILFFFFVRYFILILLTGSCLRHSLAYKRNIIGEANLVNFMCSIESVEVKEAAVCANWLTIQLIVGWNFAVPYFINRLFLLLILNCEKKKSVWKDHVSFTINGRGK